MKAILPQRANNYFNQIPWCQKVDLKRIQKLENEMSQFQEHVKQLESWKENVYLFLEALKNGAQSTSENTWNKEKGLIMVK